MNEGAAPGIEAAPSYLLSENEAPGRYVFGENAVFIPTSAAKTGVGVGFCPSDTLKIPTSSYKKGAPGRYIPTWSLIF